MQVTFPRILTRDELRAGNRVRRTGEPSLPLAGRLLPFTNGRTRGHLFERDDGGPEVLVLPRANHAPPSYPRVVRASVDPLSDSVDLTGGKWLAHPLIDSSSPFDPNAEIQETIASWKDAFSFIAEDPSSGVIGLRLPQLGALHAVHAHWAVSTSPATVVMPTGTGKTETMLSLLVTEACPRLLIVVPTDALRTQITEKFLTLGILRAPGSTLLRPTAKYPLVCTLRHRIKSTQDADAIFTAAQVIVTTSSIVGQCDDAVQDRIAELCPYLFIDEAHHAEAPTWKAFKNRFNNNRVVQFTATPFREDGKSLDGKIVFNYPLRKAQRDGYFTSISFSPVVEFNRRKADEAIASRAVEQLRRDADNGHIVMARVESVARAQEVFPLYANYSEFNPVQLHTGITSARRREEIRRAIVCGTSRIVVCVDMLGEGFDLPELKIAAFHDIRKSLAVTLQLAGRFTRTRPDLGNATFIANTADINVQDELRKLYTRDPDWNELMPQLSERVIGEQVSMQEFLQGFGTFGADIPLKTVKPASSAVVYRTGCRDWAPDRFRDGIQGIGSCAQVHHTINHAEHTLIVVTAKRVPLKWTDVAELFSWEWELYVVFWWQEQNLLFINSSSNTGEYRALAQAIAGDDAALIRGKDVFRTFAGVNRLRLQNVGLTEQLGRNVRYTGRMGADVGPALPDVQRGRARKSVLSGSGYENGRPATVGASRKGRIWSHRRERVDQLVAWCKQVGAKLLDPSIDPDEVLKGTLEAETILIRPTEMPICIDWPEDIYRSPEALWALTIGGRERSIAELSIELVDPRPEGALRFALVADDARAEFSLEFFERDETPNYRFVQRSGDLVEVLGPGGRKSGTEFFYDDPPAIWFADGSCLEGNQHVRLKRTLEPYDRNKIHSWDWTGVDLRCESQGDGKDPTSIQARVIRELLTRDYHMIVDDDGHGETADVVAIRLEGDEQAPSSIAVEFYHCKYAGADRPGARINDLYEVCGQAQKSIAWVSSPEKQYDIFTHLLRRESFRQEAGRPSRYERGDGELLQTVREMSHVCPVSLRIFVVQPGVSKAAASRAQLELFSVTENYLFETYQIPFGVIASP